MKITKENFRDRKYFLLIVVSWFRFLLWWGVEVARQVFVYRKPRAQVIRLSKSDWTFPVSSWVVAGDDLYCMISPREEREVRIYPLARMGKN